MPTKEAVQFTENNWNTLLPELKLTGPTLALAQHCSLKELTGTTLHLTIQPKYAALLNVKHSQRIQEAFAEQKGQQITVSITIEKHKETTLETPAAITERVHDANTQSAKKAISVDPTVQRIVATFDAKLVEGSVAPLK